MTRQSRRLVASLALALPALAGPGLLAPSVGAAADADAEGQRPPTPVLAKTIRIEQGYRVRELHAGRVESRRSSPLGFERSARLVEVRVDRGDRVEEGQLLALLDTRSLEAEQRQRQAQLESITSRLALAERTFERRQALRSSDHASIEELDNWRFEVQSLESDRAAAEAALERTQVALALSELRAPYAGAVTERHVDEGTVVSPGQAVLEVVESGVLEVRAGVPVDSARGLEPGSRHEVEVAGRGYPAELVAVVAKLDPATRTVPVVLRLVDPETPLRSGELARLALQREIPERGVWLPLTALTESRRGLWAAFRVVPDPEGALRVERSEVELIHAEADRAFVRGTLEEGDRVVASGVHRLVPGQRVRLQGGSPAGERPLAAARP